ncbi:Mobile element protein [Geitlerinema sp. FC II]|nr:Mobile element protein [Geitlerinema sp. FC II]
MVLRAFRYRFYPTPEQEHLLHRTLGCVRLVYNKALAARTEAWYERQERIGYAQTSSMLTQWKQEEELQFLNDVSCVPLQQGLRHLQKAFANFFAKRAKYPKFKKKRNGGSAELTRSAFRWKDGQLWIAKSSEPLNIRWSRQLPKGAEPSTVTIRFDPSGRWHVSLLVEDDTVKPLPTTEKSIGVDVGINSLAVTSDGEKITNPRHFNQHYKRLRRAQKALSRKMKDSKNQEKARRKVAKIYAKITDSRTDYLHKRCDPAPSHGRGLQGADAGSAHSPSARERAPRELSTRLVRENQTIVVEDLSVKNMVKNPKLARHISDCAWGEFVNQLDYKCQWYGRTLVKVDKWFPSSKRCGHCGHIVESLPLSVREWTCPECGTHHDRDLNAAKNLLAAGHAVSVCGADVRRSLRSSRSLHPRERRPKGHESRGQLRKTRKGRKQKPKS